LSEDTAERAAQYISNFERSLQELNPLTEDANVEAIKIAKVSDTIHRYLQDARFYLEKDKPTTSLASIAYAEGLLDALKFLNLTTNIDKDV
jgi:FAD synthetase